MIKLWALEQKRPFFDRFTEQLQLTDNSIIPVLKLFKKLITDEKENPTVYEYKNKAEPNEKPNSWRIIGTTTWGELLPKLKKPQFDLSMFFDRLTL